MGQDGTDNTDTGGGFTGPGGSSYDVGPAPIVAPIDTTSLLGTPSSWLASVPTTPSAVSSAAAAAAAPASGGGFNITNFLNALTGSAAAGVKVAQAIQGPSLIPGTNAIYNPLTGQYYNPTTGQVVNPTGASTLGLPTIAPTTLLMYGGLAVGAFLLISMLGKH